MNRLFNFSIDIDSDKIKRIYQGRARYLLVVTDDGARLQLPAQNFRPYVSSSGLQGRFEVTIDEVNKLVKLSKKPGPF